MSDPKHKPPTPAPRAATPVWYAHQGCFLGLPDIGYDTDRAPFVDVDRLRDEADRLAREIDGAAALGCVGFVHLMASLDDFVSYRFLGHPDAVRREVRADALAAVIGPLVVRARRLGLKYYIQNYELLVDRWVAGQVAGQSKPEFLARRFAECFGRLNVDGLIVTPSEAHPRGRCVWLDAWGGKPGVAAMARDYHEAVVRRCGRDLVFRLWLMVETAADWQRVQATMPADVTLCVKNTAGDFWRRVPPNPVLEQPAGDRRLSVIVDAFGQYAGWGRLLNFDRAWPAAIARCAELGAANPVQLWGSWAPSCIWPNRSASMLTTDRPVAWAGSYLENGLWEPGHLAGQLALRYLVELARGAVDPDTAMARGARAAGVPAEPLVAARPVVEDLWDTVHLEHQGQLYPLLNGWSTIYQPPRKTWRDLLAAGGRGRVEKAIGAIETGLAGLRRLADQVRGTALAETWRGTELYFETQQASFELALADPRLAGGPGPARAILERVEMLLARWAEFPVAARQWCITGFDEPRLADRPRWLRAGSLRGYVDDLKTGDLPPIPAETAWCFQRWPGR